MKRFFKAFFITLFLLIIVFIGSVGYFISKTNIGNPKEFISELKNAKDNYTFLLLGVDSLDSQNAKSTRSDTIMICNLDLKNGNANLVSIPRDTYAKIEKRGYQKINHSYSYGQQELTLKTVNELLETNIEDYMVIDYRFVEAIIDSIGGVSIDVPMDMVYKDDWADPPLEIELKKGVQVLDGKKSLQFLRFRKGYKDQDLGRVQAQQEFVSSFMQKLKDPKIILKAPSMIKAYNEYTITNMKLSDMANIGLKLSKFERENIKATTLPGEAGYKNRISYFFLNKNKTKELIESLDIK